MDPTSSTTYSVMTYLAYGQFIGEKKFPNKQQALEYININIKKPNVYIMSLWENYKGARLDSQTLLEEFKNNEHINTMVKEEQGTGISDFYTSNYRRK